MSISPEINLDLHDKQAIALETTATEVLYGGAAGGGKSHLMRVAAILWCSSIPGLQVYLFRRIHDDLVKNHIEGPTGFRELLANWTHSKQPNGKPWVEIIDDEIRFWNGSKVYLCHCKDEKHRFKYQGAEIHVLLIDELTHFTEVIYRFLRGRTRNPKALKLPLQYEGMFPRIMCGANPGNVGHLFVKSMFIDGADTYDIRQMPKSEGGMRRQFIPALLEDNPSLDADEYEGKLMGLGSKALVDAMRYGDWDVIEGAFFDCFDKKSHVVQPFTIPAHWTRFRSGDWGSAKPFSIGWWAVVSDTTVVDNTLGGKVTLPRGCLVRYREWYGAQKDDDGKTKPDTGLKMKNELIGAGIVEREAGEKIEYGVLDTACFAEDGGPSIEEQMRGGMLAEAKKRNLPTPAYFRHADKTRVAGIGSAVGWGGVRSRLLGDDDGHPMLVVFATCHDFIRTVPALQHDEVKPEDINTDGEDHVADETRYACASRPWVRSAPSPVKHKRSDYRAATQDQDSWV